MARDRSSPLHAHDNQSTLNRSGNDSLRSIVARRISRRECLERGFLAAALGVLPSGLAACGDEDEPSEGEPSQGAGALTPASPPALAFRAVAKGLDDFVRVPEGYVAFVLTALGDPIDDATPAYANDGTDRDFSRRIGDHGDALIYFPYPRASNSSSEGLLMQNHEALTDVYLHVDGPTNSPISDKTATLPRPLAEVLKEQEAHGVSLVKISKGEGGRWTIDGGFAGNRRWHVNTELVLSGPAAGSPQLVTKLTPAGDRTFGTLNNCGNGYTPWGTYLSGEENWAFYFRRGDDAATEAARDAKLARQGIVANNVDPAASLTPFNYRAWDRAEGGTALQLRFDCTASGASAADDFRNEPNHFGYVEWLLLAKDNPTLGSFEDLADIVINVRSASDATGATKMDRPEWGGVNPLTGEFYVSLTNNSSRGTTGPAVDAANPRSYQEQRGETSQTGNPNGHILRLREAGGNGAATAFSWDVYLFGAQADADPGTVNLSALGPDNDFSSPDGLWFDRRGVLWIQTDDGAYTDVTNCMMLAAIPGQVGDGAEAVVAGQATFVGKPASPDTLKRFLVGVPGSEITGVDLTPDKKTLIVGIQHPGETGTLDRFQSNWPASSGADAALTGVANNRPRTATIAISRADGGDIGV